MRRPGRWQRLVCRVRGHVAIGHQPWGGVPDAFFGITCYCLRCDADLSVIVPSRFTITSDRGERAA